MDTPGDILAFRESYWTYKNEVLEQTEAELRALFSRWEMHHYWEKYHKKGYLPGLTIPSPVQRTDVRIKRLESVEDKIRRHPEQFPAGWAQQSYRDMDDAIGARIVVYFLSDFTLIHHELHDLEDDVEVSHDPPPRAYLPAGVPERLDLGVVDRADKESGYASIHYRCRLRRSAVDLDDRPWFEIQLRTLAEDAWAEVHHLIGYKREKDTTVEVEEETRIISAQLKAIDEHFDLLRMRLGRAQLRLKKKPKAKHQINAENLPVLLDELGLLADQREVDGLLRALASRGIAHVGELRARATPARLDLIRQEWHKATGRTAQTFDVVGVLGTISASETDSEVVERTAEWSAVANRWRRRRDDDEVERVIRALRHHGVRDAKALGALASTERIAIIREQWESVHGSPPSALEVVTILTTLDRRSSTDDVARRARAIAELRRRDS